VCGSGSELGKRAELLSGRGVGSRPQRAGKHLAPLEHMLRNSLAHGIEPPERRRRPANPNRTITLSLRGKAGTGAGTGRRWGGLDFDANPGQGERRMLLPDQPATRRN